VPALLLTNDLDIKLFSSTGVVIPHGISLDVPREVLLRNVVGSRGNYPVAPSQLNGEGEGRKRGVMVKLW
jgi:hypothetical protein